MPTRMSTPGIDYTNRDYEAFRESMIQQLQIKLPEYTDLRQSDAGIVLLELLAQGLDVISFYQEVIANETFLVTAEQRDNVLKWCKLLDYIPKSATPSRFKQVFSLVSAQSKDTVIPKGTLLKTQATASEPSVYFDTETDLTIPRGKTGLEKDSQGNYMYTVDVIQGTTVTWEILGSSSGSPNQTFNTKYSPVILDSISVLVNEGDGFNKWNRVENFIDSGKESRDYIAYVNNRGEAVIEFGDGVFGKIPSSHSEGIRCTYRVGGGAYGNVGARKIVLLENPIAVVKSTFNPDLAFEEGHDRETLDEIKVNAPIAHRSVWGALTTEDFAGVTMSEFPEILSASAVAGGVNGRDITIYVLLPNKAPISDSLKQEILDMFDENKGGRKIIGSGTVSVETAIEMAIPLVFDLQVKRGWPFVEVKDRLYSFIYHYFEPGSFKIGETFSTVDLISAIMSPESDIGGIAYLSITSPEPGIYSPGEGGYFTSNSVIINNKGDVSYGSIP